MMVDRPLVAVRVAALGQVVRLGDFARRIAHRVSAGHVLAGRHPGGLLILLDLDEPALSILRPEDVARWIHSAADRPLAVGQSDLVDGLDHVPDALRQAEVALSVARRHDEGSEFAAWQSIGVERVISQIPPSAYLDLPAGLRRLLAEEPALAATLSAYVDSAGDVKRTAASLSLHRSGLYYRLQRIEELTGLDLGEGDDRLLAQLAIRLSGQSF
jgi:sugar diacid utilization regulator